MNNEVKVADLLIDLRAAASIGRPIMVDEINDLEATLSRQDAQLGGRVIGSRNIDGVHVIVVSSFSGLADEQLFVRHDDYLAAQRAQPEQQDAVYAAHPSGDGSIIRINDGARLSVDEILAALAARQPLTDEQYADEQALIDYLDSLMDDGGQGGEKWEPAQAAIRGIIAARQMVSLAETLQHYMRDESDKLPDAVFKLPQEAQRALVTLSGMAASPMRIHPRDAKEAVAYVVAAILESARQPVGQEAGETWLFKQAAGLLHARIVSASGRVVAIFKSDVSDEDGARLAGGTPPTQKGVSNG